MKRGTSPISSVQTLDGDLLKIETRGGTIVMDAADAPTVNDCWVGVNAEGHVRIRSKRFAGCKYLSCILMGTVKGEWVKHLNGDMLDFRRANLFAANRYDVTVHTDGDTARIETKSGKIVQIDTEDLPLLSGRHLKIQTAGYAVLVAEKPYKIQRLARLIMRTPEGAQCDHISGDRLDNRKQNLRNCTCSENLRNTKKMCRGQNPYKGVHYAKNTRSQRKWKAAICVKGKKQHLGHFMTAEEAARAYNAKALELSGPFARLNVLERPGETVSAAEITP